MAVPSATKKILLAAGIAGSIALAVLVDWLAPAEQTLGSMVKYVYIHNGLVFTSLALVTFVGILGLLYLVTGRRFFFDWARPAKQVALIFWTFYIIQGIVAMKVIWGGIVWNEPRQLLAFSLYFVLIAIYLVSTTVHAPKLISALNVVMGASVWFFISRISAVMHPTSSPIRNSPSVLIRASALAIFVLFLTAAVLSVILFKMPASSKQEE